MPPERKNDHNEIKSLFKEHYALLCLMAFGIVKDRETAKDVVQDFFISYWQRRADVAITTSFKAYAIGAVKNLGLLALKKATKEQSLLRNMPLQEQEYDEPKIAEVANNKVKIEALLNQLPESRRKIFISAILNGQSYAEIANNQGISVNTVKTQMKRAYAFLRTEAAANALRILLWSTCISLMLQF